MLISDWSSDVCSSDLIDLAAVTVVLSRDGETVSTGVGSNCLGNPLSAALWLARRLAGLAQPLRAGDVVLTGALGPMAAAAPGSRWDARFPGLGSVSFSVGRPHSSTHYTRALSRPPRG